MKQIILSVSALGCLGACNGSSVGTADLPLLPSPTDNVTQSVVSPAPNEAGNTWAFFGKTNVVAKQAPNTIDGVRYLDGFVSDGRAYNTRVFQVLGSTGSSNILYRGDGAYFHDSTEEGEGNLAAGIGWSDDGKTLGGYMARNGAEFNNPGGTATYTGSYQGHIAEHVALPVSGNVMLKADLGGGTISGAITNRRLSIAPFGSDRPDFVTNDVFLDQAQIETLGGFGSTISQADRVASGYYGGIFDADADKAIGLVQINHGNTVKGQSISFIESGIFKVD